MLVTDSTTATPVIDVSLYQLCLWLWFGLDAVHCKVGCESVIQKIGKAAWQSHVQYCFSR